MSSKEVVGGLLAGGDAYPFFNALLVLPVLAIVMAYVGFPLYGLLEWLQGSTFGGMDVTLLFIAGFFLLKKIWAQVGSAVLFVGFLALVYLLA